MPRRPKPFLYRGWYCTNSGGIPQQKLCRAEQGHRQAELALARLLVQRADARDEAKVQVPGPGIANPQLPAPRIEPGTLACLQAKTVAEVFDEFLDAKRVETDELTYTHYRDKLTAFLERFGTRPIRSLAYQDGLAYKNWLMRDKKWLKGKTKMRGFGPCSVNHHIRAAKTLFNWAAKPSRRYIDFNPWEELSYLTEKPRERLITDEEFQHLLANCTDGNVCGGARDLREQLIVLRHTTLRPGELRKLRWDYIQWDKHRFVFPATVIKTKTRRVVTMLPVVEDTLRQREKRLEDNGLQAEGFVFPAPGKDKRGRRAAVAKDHYMKANSFSQRFRRLVQRCVEQGLIEEEKAGERLVLYNTRHTRITELVTADIPMKAVMDEAGHKVPATTNRYTHLADEFTTNIVRQRAGRQVGETSASDG